MSKKLLIAAGLLALAGFTHATFWEDNKNEKAIDGGVSPMMVAIPNDPNTNIIQVFDPNDPSFPYFPLLLTENTGYKIECSNITKLKGMFTGLGFEPEMLAWMEQVPLDDARVVDSGYELNPSLYCDTSAQLLAVAYPEEKKYFLDLDGLNSNKVNHIGCQGLLDAMGYDLESAHNIDPSTLSIYFNADDANDIHCMNGVPAGEIGSCGEYANGESWDQMIQNGTQTYICLDGVSQIEGDPVCDTGYEANDGQCVYVPLNCGSHAHGSVWTDPIENGQQSYTCNDGTTSEVGAPQCNSGYLPNGNQCIYQPLSCGNHSHGSSWIESIANGSRTYSCDDGTVIEGSASCNAGYNWNGAICEYIPKSCISPVTGSNHLHNTTWSDAIANGSRSFSCQDGNVTNTNNSCDSRYSWNGTSCVYIPNNCKSPVTNATHNHGSSWSDTIPNGSRSFSCHDGTVKNTSNNCNSNFEWNGSSCVEKSDGCSGHAHGGTSAEFTKMSMPLSNVLKSTNTPVISLMKNLGSNYHGTEF